jgi:hypothetical protein
MQLFENITKIFHCKFQKKITKWRAFVAAHLVVLVTRWDKAVARMTGEK